MDDGNEEYRGDSVKPKTEPVRAQPAPEALDQGPARDPDTVKIVAHALSLSGSQRRVYLHGQADGSTARYEQLVRLVRWSELNPAGHPFKDSKAKDQGSSQSDSPEQLQQVWENVLAHLRAQGPRPDALEPRALIAEGGMGEIREAWDPVLRRIIAIKSLRRDEFPDPTAFGFPHHAALLRFVEEARITGQLDHPGIVPVHSLGLDAEGHIYFSMRRVRGQDLSDVFDAIAAGDSTWTITRVLGVLQRVCEAMAYAHDKGVVHRDLKPANIMIGRYGEVHVLDWGVARIIGSEEDRRQGLRKTAPITHTKVGQHKDSDAILTQEGDILGTPAYMSPEQAAGKLSDLGPHSDVYSVGAMLYHLLAGKAPYGEESLRPAQILARIAVSPPAPLEGRAKHVAPELIAICNKSMARRPGERYRDMGEMAQDLTAFLEQRVVRAHKVGALIELRKWVRRNRRFAASLAALFAVAISAVILIALSENRRAREVQRSADMDAIELLENQFWSLGPIGEESLEERRRWLSSAQRLVSIVPRYRAEFEELALKGTPRPDPLDGLPQLERDSLEDLAYWIEEREKWIAESRERLATEDLDADAGAQLEAELAFAEPDVQLRKAEYRARMDQARIYYGVTHENPVDRKRHERLVRFLTSAEALTRPGTGLISRAKEEIASGSRLVEDANNRDRELWQEAITTIASLDDCPAYGGMHVEPVPGLVPLGLNFESGLYEFWHTLSGLEPHRGDDGQFSIGADEGMVFILVPGGVAKLAVPDGKGGAAILEAQLDPFFLSKFEMTQEQWKRLTGSNPSLLWTGLDTVRDGLVLPGHPVEFISWEEADRNLARWNLTLPTSFQWTLAASGGPGNEDWRRNDFATRSQINAAQSNVDPRQTFGTVSPIRSDPDGSSYHSRVGAFAPNPMGFHEILGNIGEFCADWHIHEPSEVRIQARTGLALPQGYRSRKYFRGGSFKHVFTSTVVMNGIAVPPQAKRNDVGVRPVFVPPNQ